VHRTVKSKKKVIVIITIDAKRFDTLLTKKFELDNKARLSGLTQTRSLLTDWLQNLHVRSRRARNQLCHFFENRSQGHGTPKNVFYHWKRSSPCVGTRASVISLLNSQQSSLIWVGVAIVSVVVVVVFLRYKVYFSRRSSDSVLSNFRLSGRGLNKTCRGVVTVKFIFREYSRTPEA